MTVMSTIRTIWVRFVLVCLIGACVGCALAWWAARGPPITVSEFREADGFAVRGSSIELRVTATRTRYCTVKVDRWLWQDTGEVDSNGRPILKYATLPPAVAPPTPLGVRSTYIMSIPLPSDVGPGLWFYRSRGVDECAWLPWLDRPPRESPAAAVVITESSEPTLAPPPQPQSAK